MKNKNIFLSLVSIMVFHQNIMSQNLYPIKESYDGYLERHYTTGPNFDYTDPMFDTDPNNYQNGGWVLLSYLRMYEATGDKAYLNKFITNSFGYQRKRVFAIQIFNTTFTFPIWPAPFYMNGLLLRPMSEFVYLIKIKRPSLGSTPLLTPIQPSTINSSALFTYDDYADWLGGRVQQTLDYFISTDWINSFQCFSKNGNSTPAEINMQSAFACSMFYMGVTYPSNSNFYTSRAESIVSHFISPSANFFTYPQYNCFTWFHNYWQYFYSNNGTLYREDVPHGAMDIQMPLVADELYLNGIFQPSEMDEFARTFTFNIWDRYSNVFHNTVFGSGEDNSGPLGAIPVNEYWSEIPAWMGLYKYDLSNDPLNDLYHIVLNHTVNLLSDNASAHVVPIWLGASHNLNGPEGGVYGISEVIKAQWDIECVNLSLYKRDLVYDQDFNVKNILTIEPESSSALNSSNSFADPIINTSTFTVEPNVTSTIQAGDHILLESGFTAKSGCHFVAKTSSCADLDMIQNSNSSSRTRDPNTSSNQQCNISKHFGLNVYPNPTNDALHLSTNISGENITVKIIDVLGNKISEAVFSGSETMLDVTPLRSGIYFVEIIYAGRSLNAKFVKQ